MADAIVSLVMEQLISTITEEIKQEVRLVTGVTKEVNKLTTNFKSIQAVLHDAEQKGLKERAVALWLDRLKDASYDIDDILDEWNTAILKLQSHETNLVSNNKVRFLSCTPTFCFKRVGLRRDIALRVKEMSERLDGIAKDKVMYTLDKIRDTEEPLKLKSSTAFDLDVSEVCGRDEEKMSLISKLLSHESHDEKGIQVISIVGLGGIGKTTLAQLAYNDDKVKNNFEKRIWVCVSDPFDEIRVAKAIIDELKVEAPNLAVLQSLLACIHESIAMKKFLLVLDDVWTEDYSKWGPFFNCLKNGLNGNRILVTTRKEKVAHVMKSINVINVGELSGERSWLLFKQLAFCDRSIEECNKLEKYGQEIVGKCKGLPLAIKTLGSLLRFKKTEQQWQSILRSELWYLKELEEGVFAPLLLSYNSLPSMVKQCFSYCAVFPKDSILKKDELIRLWMAQGYLFPKQNEEMEIVGEECFDHLVMHSFFQDFLKDVDGNIIYCKMHDIVHDFAQYTGMNKCFADSGFATNVNASFEKTRHLKLLLNDEDAPFSFKRSSVVKLRSLFVEGKYDDTSSNGDILSKLFKELRCLRVLELDLNQAHTCRFPIEKMMKEIEEPIHLRYLNLSTLGFKELPEKLCELYNLQTLNVSDCSSLEKLPHGIGKLINLRHLINYGTSKLKYMPKGIERLTSLQTLSLFVVGSDANGSEVCKLESIKKLKHLRGSLIIAGLGYVTNEAELVNADLPNKNIVNVILNFDYEGEASSSTKLSRNDAAVLQALPPLPIVSKFKILNCRGMMASYDLMVSFTRLRELFLRNCINWVHLPALGKLPLLERLNIMGMNSVKRVGNEFLGIENVGTSSSSSSSVALFPKLESLVFDDMEQWEDWEYDFTKTAEQDMTIMPCLSTLSIFSCPKLKALPDHLVHAISENKCWFDTLGHTLLGKWENISLWQRLCSQHQSRSSLKSQL